MTEERKNIYTKEELRELGVSPEHLPWGLPSGTKLAGYTSRGQPVVERVLLSDSEEQRALDSRRSYLVLGSSKQSAKELSNLENALRGALEGAVVDSTFEKSNAAQAIRDRKYGVVVVVSKGSDMNIDWASAAMDRGQTVAVYATTDFARLQRLRLPYAKNGDDLVRLLVDGPSGTTGFSGRIHRAEHPNPKTHYHRPSGQ